VYQLTLPGWVKTRGMGFYLVAFQGGMAVGSAAVGIAAEHAGLSRTFAATGAGLILGPLIGFRYKFQTIAPEALVPAGDWPQPHVSADESLAGPVMVSVEYWPRPEVEDEFLTAISALRYSRRRTGASTWKVWRDAEQPGRFVEQFMVASWEQHLRQHERVTQRDQERLERIVALTDPDHPMVVTHWLTPESSVSRNG
jgi:Transmembrane secretion effector